MITHCRLNNPELIALASAMIFSSVTPVLWTRSDPDKSTMCNLETSLTFESAFWVSSYMIKMQWDLVEASFFGVSETALFVSPMNSKFKASSSVSARCTDRFLSVNLPSAPSYIITLGKSNKLLDEWFSSSKSYPYSL